MCLSAKSDPKFPRSTKGMSRKMVDAQELRKMVTDGSSIDVSDPKEAALLVQVLKDLPPVREMQLRHPTPEVVEAITELNLESLSLRHDNMDKGGFADEGRCFVKLLQGEKLTSLDMEFSKDASELRGVLDGLKQSHLQELKIGNPRGAEEEQALSQALTGIPSLEKLEVRNLTDEKAVGSLINGLASPENNVSDFYFRSKFPCHEQIGSLLQKPECKLVKLGLVLHNPDLISSRDSSYFSLAVGSSKLEDLTLLVDASSGGDCSLLQELAVALNEHKFGAVQLMILNSDISNVSLKEFFRGNVESLKLTTFGTKVPPDILTQLLGALEDPEFKMKHLIIGGDAPFSPEDSRRIVRCLEKNFQCSLESLQIGDNWNEDPLSRFCEQVLGQNKIYRSATATAAHGLADVEKVERSDAKLYVCGDKNVGKSTLRRNLFKKYNALAWFHLSSDNGLHLDNLSFGDKSLLICDFNGPAEFNALHHFLVKGTDKDMFFVVCRAPSKDGHEHFEDRLRHWLKFILSHRSLPDQKPRVMIILNYFHESEKAESKMVDMNQDAFNRCSTVVTDFAEQIDLGSNKKNNIFGVRATRPSQLRNLKLQMEASLKMLLKSRPKVPAVCKSIMKSVKAHEVRAADQQATIGKIQTACQHLQQLFSSKKSTQKKVLSVEDVASICREIDKDFLKVCLTFLHNEGDVIYFEENVAAAKQYVIVDVWWFARNVVRLFVHESRDMPIAEVRAKLANHCEEEHFDYMVFVLEKLGVVLLDDVARPTIVKGLCCWEASPPLKWRGGMDTSGTTGTQKRSFWGRRYQCKDPFTLLPFGVFTVLLMRISNMFPARQVGGGWLYIVENEVHVIIKFGDSTREGSFDPQKLGTTSSSSPVADDLYDRQWIDLLAMLPDAASLNETSDALLHKLRECLLTICAGQGCAQIELEEKVIRPGSVQDISCDEAEPLATFLEEADRNFHIGGLVTKHNWRKQRHLGESCFIYEVMTLSERNNYNSDKLKKLEPIKYEVLDCLPEQITETPVSDAILTAGSDEDTEFKRELRKAVLELKKTIFESEQRIILKIKDLEAIVTKEMELLRGQGDKLLAKLKLLVDFDMPRYPYFTSNDNVLQKYSSDMFGKKMRLHLLCEHGNCHHVEKQQGLDINVRPEWFHKSAHVLVPALRILFVAAQIVTTMYLGAKLPFRIPPPFNKDYKFGGVQTLMKQVFGEETEGSRDLYKTSPTRDELQQFYEVFLKSMITDKPRDMNSFFGLHQVNDSGNKSLWVCDLHLSMYSS